MLFADVVHSMDIAAAVGAERLREIMADLVDRAAAVVGAYGGTMDKFTGDGVMALFGAPVALEDHARRACLAALDLQRAARRLSIELAERDGIAFHLRVGLNSGEVITGEIGSGPWAYTAVGEQVGMAQRMESVAEPDAVMVSDSTARLVDGVVELGDPQQVRVKGFADTVPARRLVAASLGADMRRSRRLSPLIGRDWEVSTIAGLLDQSVAGKGRVVGVVGSPGIGKSRMVDETMRLAEDRGVEVFTTYCESHTSNVSFHVAARLLREVFGLRDLDDATARATIRARLLNAGSEDVSLLDDLLGIADPDAPMPDINPDARRRRLAAMLNTAAAARTTPAVYVVEDAHWIDAVSESMMAEFAAVMPQARALMLVSYRPEYNGALDRLPGAHRISLAPLDDSDSAVMTAKLLGSDDSVQALAVQVAGRAAGNPFFAEEMVRDLAERGVITGTPGAYTCRQDSATIRVPATLQATIAARIDRLGTAAKRTLNAAAVLGMRFDVQLLDNLVAHPDIAELVGAELVDQVTFSPRAEYSFRHPMIRTVAYESQLKADRGKLHRRLADNIVAQSGDPDSSAALIAGHLEAAGDTGGAYEWHMRAAAVASSRDVRAARISWQHAAHAADRLPDEWPGKVSMQMVPRTLFCGNAWREWGSAADPVFDELRELATTAGDQVTAALAMAGRLTALVVQDQFAEASRQGTELAELVDSIPDPMLTVELLIGVSSAKFHAGEVNDGLRYVQRVIDLVDGDPLAGKLLLGSPLALALAVRGANRWALGIPGWQSDFDEAVDLARPIDRTCHGMAIMYKYACPGHNGALSPGTRGLSETAEALEAVDQSSDDLAFWATELSRGVVLVHQGEGTERRAGIELLAQYRRDALARRPWTSWLRVVDTEMVEEQLRLGNVDTAIAMARNDVGHFEGSGDMTSRGPAYTVLLEALLRRGTAPDLAEARAVVDELAAVPVDDGFVLHELPLLRMRALLARADGDDSVYRDLVRDYRNRAGELGFAEHLAFAATMS